MDIPQEVIENAPEGATHWNAVNRMFYLLSETENRVWSCNAWAPTGMNARDAERSPEILIPLPPRDNHLGWRPMSERPERAGVILVDVGLAKPSKLIWDGKCRTNYYAQWRTIEETPDMPWFFDLGEKGWRYADDQAAPVVQQEQPTYSPRDDYEDGDSFAGMDEPDDMESVRDSDREGIASFTPPPEPPAPPVKPKRVSTLRRGWNWLGGAP